MAHAGCLVRLAGKEGKRFGKRDADWMEKALEREEKNDPRHS